MGGLGKRVTDRLKSFSVVYFGATESQLSFSLWSYFESLFWIPAVNCTGPSTIMGVRDFGTARDQNPM